MEKAYLQGFRLGDLYVTMKTDGPECASIDVNSTTSRVAQLNLYCELFGSYGHPVVSSGQDGVHRFHCLLNTSFAFLLPKEDCIPEDVFQAVQIEGKVQPFLAFLAGYVDAEGCFCLRSSGYAEFNLGSYESNLLRQTHAILNNLGVICPPPYLAMPKGTRVTGTQYKTNNDLWRLGVYRKASLYRLCEMLEPHLKHAEKRQAMYAMWSNVTARGAK